MAFVMDRRSTFLFRPRGFAAGSSGSINESTPTAPPSDRSDREDHSSHHHTPCILRQVLRKSPLWAAWQPSLAPFSSETWNDRPRDLKPIVREFKNEDVTEMASMRLDEMLRRKFCAIGLNGACSQRLPSHNNNNESR
jgi:hypothetical protein